MRHLMLLTVLSAGACAPLVSNRDFAPRDVHPTSSVARRQAADATPAAKPVAWCATGRGWR